MREKKVGYESYPRSQPSKRTLFGRSACPSAAGSLAIVRFPHFFAPTAPLRALWSRTRKRSWVRILCREPGCRWCPFTARPARRGRLAPPPRRARRQGRHPSPRPPPGSPRRLRVRRGRRCATTAGARAPSRGASAASPPRARHRAASCPSDAAPARPASRGVLPRPASRPGARRGRAVQGLRVGCTFCAWPQLQMDEGRHASKDRL